jgi:thiol-disulfide isomerase/thioredoxin
VKKCTALALLLLAFHFGYSQYAYSIKLTLRPYRHVKVYLGYYYGKIRALADSALLDANATGTFHGKEKLPSGIYFIVSPRKEILFEVLLDKDEHFEISADSASLPDQVLFTNSPENTLFLSYSLYMAKEGKAIHDQQIALSAAKDRSDSTLIRQHITALSQEVQLYRDKIQKDHSQSLLTVLLMALKEPVIPPALGPKASQSDSLYAYHYYKAHYWDEISFTDDRLIRTPILEPKLDKYFKDVVVPDADSIEREVDHMLLVARVNKEMFKYLLVYFVQKYINPEYMGQDAVFVHLFEKYINTGQADFFTDKYRKFANDRAYSLMANLIGQPAPNLIMTDTSEQVRQLYDVDAPFIVVCFWDPTCSHCKETVPKLDSIYQAKWKSEGVQIFGVMVDGGKDAWLKFIRDNNLRNWIHVYQTDAQHTAEIAGDRPGYRQLFDVYQTPILYLLDKEKRIIAKKLTYLQLDEVISLKIKSVKSR